MAVKPTLILVLFAVAVSSLRPHSVVKRQSLCDLARNISSRFKPFISGDIGPVVIFYNDTQPGSDEILCVLKLVVPHARLERIVLDVNTGMVCIEMLVYPAKPGELHVLVAVKEMITPFCLTQAIGSMPNQLEMRRVIIPGRGPTGDFFTFSLISNGGNLAFDVLNLHNIETAKNVMLALKTLLSVYVSGRPWENGFPKFFRRFFTFTNPQLAFQKRTLITERFGDPMHFMFNFRFIPVLLYGSLIAFLLVIPFTRRKIKVDRVTLEHDEVGVPRDDDVKPASTLPAKKRTSSETPPSGGSHGWTPPTKKTKTSAEEMTGESCVLNPPQDDHTQPSVSQKKSKQMKIGAPRPTISTQSTSNEQ